MQKLLKRKRIMNLTLKSGRCQICIYSAQSLSQTDCWPYLRRLASPDKPIFPSSIRVDSRRSLQVAMSSFAELSSLTHVSSCRFWWRWSILSGNRSRPSLIICCERSWSATQIFIRACQRYQRRLGDPFAKQSSAPSANTFPSQQNRSQFCRCPSKLKM